MIALIIIVLLVIGFTTYTLARKISCSGLITREKAQLLFDSNKALYRSLDRDGDGRACEKLPTYRKIIHNFI